MKSSTHLAIVGIAAMFSMATMAETPGTHALGAHVHGVATLQVTVDAKVLSLSFSSPLDNLLGFEHKARNQAEVKQVQNMINQFYKSNLFAPSKAAQCKLQTINLESLVIKKKPQAASAKPHDHEEEAGHADLDAEMVYLCNDIKNLRDLQVNLFKAFPNLHQLNVEIVSSRGQAATKLTPANIQVVW
ncbi:MAG: DUF2796 domain-containing protein [Methylococcaceae bacterium]|nr:DUF2796 domain-containing protein [Methylococcaceae bacterium]